MSKTRRSKPYCVRLGDRHQTEIPGYRWQEHVAKGWLVPVVIEEHGEPRASRRIAEPRDGVKAWLQDGKLHLFDMLAGIEVSIPSSWRLVERAAIFSQRGIPAYTKTGVRRSSEEMRAELEREILQQYVTI